MRNSLKKLSKKKESEIKLDLATLLADIKNPLEMNEFLDSFLTETEFIGLSKRISIIKLLSKGDSYEEIQEKINVSSATISTTANFKNDKILEKVINKLNIDEWASKLAQKINKLLNFN